MDFLLWVADSSKDRRFWTVLSVCFVTVMVSRYRGPVTPIVLPEAAHNVVGDLPIIEEADDGYVSSIEERPHYAPKKPNFSLGVSSLGFIYDGSITNGRVTYVSYDVSFSRS